jgi:hypothetical protein
MDESIVLPEQDEGLGAELNQGINEFNARATWIGDGRLLQAELRDDEGRSRGRANWLDVGPSQARWTRGDLYEVVTFAKRLSCRRAAIIDFGDPDKVRPPIGFGWGT